MGMPDSVGEAGGGEGQAVASTQLMTSQRSPVQTWMSQHKKRSDGIAVKPSQLVVMNHVTPVLLRRFHVTSLLM